MMPRAPNGVILSNRTGVTEDLFPDAMPPAYVTAVHLSDGVEDQLPDAEPPAYDTVVHLSYGVEDSTHSGWVTLPGLFCYQ